MGKIRIDEEFCKGCMLCVNFCPQKLIQVSNHVSKKGYHPAEFSDPQSKCSGCTLCALVCPDAAITVYKERKTDVVKK
ncbi:ferredoxin family protein [Candidatus Bathyarchaeota archaeon]|nr:ferredoxin family protein [Candidatus Bathyarchaeota archaeon]